VALIGAMLVVLGLVLGLIAFGIGAAGYADAVGWWVASSAIALVLGMIGLGSIYCIHAEHSLVEIIRGQTLDSPAAEEGSGEAAETAAPEKTPQQWSDLIAAAGAQSRIGDAIRGVLTDHDPSTLAGIVLLSDGQNNGGLDAGAGVAAARRTEVALYPVGLGSSEAPINVRVVDLNAPRRVYPGDKFAINAVLQASGPREMEVEVQLLDGLDPDAGEDGSQAKPAEVIDSKKAKVSSDGTLSGIRFELEPESVGRRRLAVRVVSPPEDQNKEDDSRDARYEVVSRKLRVMAVAGGPTREYRFVRNLLFRDNSIELDVWLQTGREGLSQDADRVLQEFPSTAEALFEYDAIIVFDPDWMKFKIESLDLLDRWLSEQAGGMILVAGPVFHPYWSRKRTNPRVPKIAGFFPVNLSTRGALLGGGRQGGTTSWPIDFTPEARRAEFLWIAEDPEESFEIWDSFGGIYDYVGTKSAKPGAKVYGYFSDPTSEVGGVRPIFMASQFYGAGRV
ncbi:MAG: VWA domain-containing protein, partial [Pirellulales bacterium]|nr:VWA domain-containing protein [Pirellulales bacterium]